MDDLNPRLPFTRGYALARGVTADDLRSRRFRRLFRGVFVAADVPVDLALLAAAARLRGPIGAIISHATAMGLYGLSVDRDLPIHLSTRTTGQSREPGIVVHRRRADIACRDVAGLPVTSPERTFVDCAAMRISFVKLVTIADWLVHQRLTTVDNLTYYVHARHLDGVRRARRAMRLVSGRAESPMETLVRLMIVFARLPVPLCNRDILDTAGTFLARGDLVFEQWKVVVEYDGKWHERSAEQRRSDRDRRERLEAAGWRVIVVYDTDLAYPARIPHRVHAALVKNGYTGPAPVTSSMWHRWFASV